VRRALLLLAVVLALAGCGGGKSAETTSAPATTTSADPGRDAIEAFAAAARAGNTGSMWRLLSASSRQRLGPTQGAFGMKAGPGLATGLGTLRAFHVVVSERVTPEFGVVAIEGTRAGKRTIYAVPLRLEGTQWKVELGGPVRVRPLGPLPGAREDVVAQIGAAVEGQGGAGTAVMYLDGQAVGQLKVYRTATNSTLVANFDPALDPGRHTVVVFASDAREATASAWDFTARRK
jgi:hypothetical protein